MQRKQIILLHIIYWSAMLIVVGLEVIPSLGKTSADDIIADYVIYAVSFISVFYLYYFFISKKHLDKKNMTIFILSGLIFIFIFTVPVAYIYIYFLARNIFELSGKKFLMEFCSFYFRLLETNFMFAMTGSLLKIALLWYENVMKQKEAEKQLISGELALLRSQINPQFLFSTLKNIKSMVEKSPEKAIYSIESLSEIMNYMLYETSAEKVLLSNEINNINNYLNLQRIRYGKDYCRFEVYGDAKKILISPLLFMPFIENAFKYTDGVEKTPGIIITINITENNLLFEVSNQTKVNTGEIKFENSLSANSIKRHLDIIYGKEYSLETNNEKNKSSVKLCINLT